MFSTWSDFILGIIYDDAKSKEFLIPPYEVEKNPMKLWKRPSVFGNASPNASYTHTINSFFKYTPILRLNLLQKCIFKNRFPKPTQLKCFNIMKFKQKNSLKFVFFISRINLIRMFAFLILQGYHHFSNVQVTLKKEVRLKKFTWNLDVWDFT